MNTVYDNTCFDQRMLNGTGTRLQDDTVNSLGAFAAASVYQKGTLCRVQ